MIIIEMILSPCINVCKLDRGLCTGCYRTVEEIKGWQNYSIFDKSVILLSLPGRKEFHKNRLDEKS